MLLWSSFSAGDDAFTATAFVLLSHLAANIYLFYKKGSTTDGFNWWFHLTSRSVIFRWTVSLPNITVQDGRNESPDTDFDFIAEVARRPAAIRRRRLLQT